MNKNLNDFGAKRSFFFDGGQTVVDNKRQKLSREKKGKGNLGCHGFLFFIQLSENDNHNKFIQSAFFDVEKRTVFKKKKSPHRLIICLKKEQQQKTEKKLNNKNVKLEKSCSKMLLEIGNNVQGIFFCVVDCRLISG